MKDPRYEAKADKAWAFVKGAALYAGAIGYWAARPEPQPYGLVDFIDEQIHFCCGKDARAGRAGMAWASDADATSVTLAQTLERAAEYAGLRTRRQKIATTCVQQGIAPETPLHQVSDEAAAIAAKIWG
jgi:hypothetical protein